MGHVLKSEFRDDAVGPFRHIIILIKVSAQGNVRPRGGVIDDELVVDCIVDSRKSKEADSD